MLSLIRIIKFAFQDIVRNIGLSFMTIFILILMLLSINTLVVINVLTSEAVSSIKDQIDISIYFNHEASDEEIDEIKTYVNSFPEVLSIAYLNKDQVLENFKNEHKDSEDVMSALNELSENPLGSTIVVKTRDPRDYTKIITALSVPEYENIIEAKTFANSQKAIDRINIITNQVETFAIFLSALFAIIAFLIIFNTIRVAIYTHRSEISIKKLVGATNWFVRGPYVVESLVFSVLSLGLSYLATFFTLKFLDPFVAVVFNKEAILLSYYQNNFWEIVLLQFVLVFLITLVSSLLAMRRYLRV